MTTETLNPFLAANRLKKALALADFLDAAGVEADTAELYDLSEWELIAREVRVKTPSPATCTQAIEMLRSRESVRLGRIS